MKKILISCLVVLFLTACKDDKKKEGNSLEMTETVSSSAKKSSKIESQSDNLVIKKLTDHVFLHTSFLDTEDFGKVPCNGMIVFNNKEAVVFDTPADKKASRELIQYITDSLHGKIKAVVPTHFHKDCVAGLGVFLDYGVPVYAYKKTVALLRENENSLYGWISSFQGVLALDVGGKKVYATFFGEGHTKDNIVGYFPAEKTLFGGCLIKAKGAQKGNLADANIKAWPKTVEKLREKYPELKVVIPGHGKPSGVELFDYTIQLFQE